MTEPLLRTTRAPYAVVAAVVAFVFIGQIYGDALAAHFFNDDHQWLQGARRFTWAALGDLSARDHFYRPALEVYFAAAFQALGCEPGSWHGVNVLLHGLNTVLLFGLALAITRSSVAAPVTALLFAVQPAYVEAVAWVSAAAELLVTTWSLVALWCVWSLRTRGGWWRYAGALAATAAALATHESAVALVPLVVGVDLLHDPPASAADAWAWLRTRAAGYAPFAVILLLFLGASLVVNQRNYVVEEGGYALGWHAVPNLLDSIANLYIGRKRLSWQIGTAVVLLALAWRGTPRMRFGVWWLVVTLLPVSLFATTPASRYLYLPAVGFALLLVELGRAAHGWLEPRLGIRPAAAVMAVLAVVMVARSTRFAERGVSEFSARSAPYARFDAAVRRAERPEMKNEVVVSAADVEGIPPLYLEGAAETALCRPGYGVTVR